MSVLPTQQYFMHLHGAMNARTICISLYRRPWGHNFHDLGLRPGLIARGRKSVEYTENNILRWPDKKKNYCEQ